MLKTKEFLGAALVAGAKEYQFAWFDSPCGYLLFTFFLYIYSYFSKILLSFVEYAYTQTADLCQ